MYIISQVYVPYGEYLVNMGWNDRGDGEYGHVRTYVHSHRHTGRNCINAPTFLLGPKKWIYIYI